MTAKTNTLRRTAAWIHTLLLLLIALILSRAALAALRLGKASKNRCELARDRAATLGPNDGAWCELSGLLHYALARTALTCSVRWSGRSQRLYVLVNQARI